VSTPCKAVFFDLDGTLADTAPDLAYALNQTLQRAGRPALPYETIRPAASHGAAALLQVGFGSDLPDDERDQLRQHLLDVYQANITRHTALFPGMDELLQRIEARGLRWGVVTNKPSYLTIPIMQGLGLAQRACSIVSGDTLSERKPHPAPLIHACREANCLAAESLYLGDAERDIQAGRSAGMRTLVALYGYIGEADAPHAWGADGRIHAPLELLDWLNTSSHTK
jgi:phosphoglycolate phosphatase